MKLFLSFSIRRLSLTLVFLSSKREVMGSNPALANFEIFRTCSSQLFRRVIKWTATMCQTASTLWVATASNVQRHNTIIRLDSVYTWSTAYIPSLGKESSLWSDRRLHMLIKERERVSNCGDVDNAIWVPAYCSWVRSMAQAISRLIEHGFKNLIIFHEISVWDFLKAYHS
jgi:hypothetical protein